MDNLLAKRRALKKKKPVFLRQDAHKKVKVSNNWRKPKGSDSKMRVSRKGYRRSVAVGWGSPGLVRGLTRDGLVPVLVSCSKDVLAVDSKVSCIVVASSVGTKKRLDLLALAKEKGIKIGNIKDYDVFVASQKKRLESKKKVSAEKASKRAAAKEKVKKESEKKAKKDSEAADKKASDDKVSDAKAGDSGSKDDVKSEDSVSVDEKKAEEKKEQDKLLIKRK